MDWSDERLPVAAPGVIFRAVDGGAVLLAMPDEIYFGLNAVGVRVWELLPPATATVSELCAALCRQYPDVDPAVIRADVVELLGALAGQRLVALPAAAARTA